MAASNGTGRWLTISITLTLATISASTAISVYFWNKKSRVLNVKLRELQISLKASLKNCAAERQGRIRAQQDLRKALLDPKSDNLELTSYPMVPIAVIHSCFSTSLKKDVLEMACTNKKITNIHDGRSLQDTFCNVLVNRKGELRLLMTDGGLIGKVRKRGLRDFSERKCKLELKLLPEEVESYL